MKPLNTKNMFLLSVIFFFNATNYLFATSGNNKWNLRENGDDRFHSNEAWVRPWRGSTDDGWGRFVGGYSYEIPWGSVSTIGNSSGGFSISRGRDNQFHAWTYVYSQYAKSIPFSGSGDCVPRFFINYAFDTPTTSIYLNSGWNRIDITGYNQNDSYTFTCDSLASMVDIMDNSEFDITPDADFTWAPSQGWAGTTQFNFTDISTNNPDLWCWDLDNDNICDYASQNVTAHTFTVPDGTHQNYTTRLYVSRLDKNDQEIKLNIITVYGKPIANFYWEAIGYSASFENTSTEPGKNELGGYTYEWDLDNDGIVDSVEENPEWTYPSSGDYLVHLTVTNAAGSGEYSSLITIDKPNLHLTYPNGGESLIAGGTRTYDIHWSTEGIVENVIIEYSPDSDSTWNPVEPQNIGNSGSYQWLVPTINSSECLLRVTDADHPDIFDYTDGLFTIFICSEQLTADLDGDCFVDLNDFAILAQQWLRCGNPFEPSCL